MTTPTSPTSPAEIDLLVMDVDGVLTPGEIIYDNEGRELKRFDVRDGFGLKLWHTAGFASAIITGRGGPMVSRRADELGITHHMHRVSDKGAAMRQLAEQTGVPTARMAYIGDDWPDLPAMHHAGLPAAPADAEAPVLETAAWVSTRPGGRGAVRELVEHLLRGKGLYEGLLARHGYDRP